MAAAFVYKAYVVKGDLSASTLLLAAASWGIIVGIEVIAVLIGWAEKKHPKSIELLLPKLSAPQLMLF